MRSDTIKQPDFFYNLPDKIEMAIKRLREFEPKDNPYYLAFSGGKDSQVIYKLAQMSGVKFEVHMNQTSVDPKELLDFVRTNYTDVILHKPVKSMYQLIVEKGFPPTRQIRYCCEVLKERGGNGRFIVTGIRGKESYKRGKRKMVEACYKDKTKWYIHPIIDWTEEDVWAFIKQQKMPYCKLYDEGFKRLGCAICPKTSFKQMQFEAAKWPQFEKMYVGAMDKALRHDRYKTKPPTQKSGQEMFDWWVGRTKDISRVMTDDELENYELEEEE